MAFLRSMSAVWYFSALSVLTHPTYSFSPSIGSAIPYSGAERASLSPVWLQAKPSYINMIDSNSDHLEESYSHASIDRRVFVQWGAVTTALLIGGAVAPAIADVSDGTALPEGAAQFGRVVRTKLDLGVISKRVSQAASEMDETEWKNVGGYLRRVYNVSDDMKQIAGGFYDPEKKKKAGELIDSLKKTAKAADAVADSKTGTEFLAYTAKLDEILEGFLELLRDVPDEL